MMYLTVETVPVEGCKHVASKQTAAECVCGHVASANAKRCWSVAGAGLELHQNERRCTRRASDTRNSLLALVARQFKCCQRTACWGT